MDESHTSFDRTTRYKSGAAREFIEDHLSRGIVSFSLADFRKHYDLSALASRRQLERLGSWVLKLPRKEFYLIVSPEHRAIGAPPPLWWLDDYFRYLQRPYYVALQSAAAIHGSEPQAIQAVQVMTDCLLKEIDLGRILIRFFFKRFAARTPTQLADRARSPLKISTPPATVLDLIRYSSRIGGLARVWETVAPFLPKVHASELRQALETQAEPALGQRLGYLLESAGNERLAGVVEKWLSPVPHWTLLEPGASAQSGPRMQRWRIYKNTELRIS